METVNRILKFKGPHTKIIIWAHNNHVGDSRFATMHWLEKVSLGNLLRSHYGERNVFIAGAGSYSGTLLAAEKWGNAFREMTMAVADDSTWEQKMHQLSPQNKIIISKEISDKPSMMRWISHMGIGVTYHPLDRTGIYTLSVLPDKYDAFLFFEKSHALHPIVTQGNEKGRFNGKTEDY
jgi:erythromycin esterase-like protein